MRCSQWGNTVGFIIFIWRSLLSFEVSMLADTGRSAQAYSHET